MKHKIYVPVVLVKSSRKNECHSWVIEFCPYCGGRHWHGAANTLNKEDLNDTLGERCSHCIIPQTPGYNLVWDGTVKENKDLRKVRKRIVNKITKEFEQNRNH